MKKTKRKTPRQPVQKPTRRELERRAAIAVARREYQTDECEIDDIAKISDARPHDAGVWVAAWVWVTEDEINTERRKQARAERAEAV